MRDLRSPPKALTARSAKDPGWVFLLTLLLPAALPSGPLLVSLLWTVRSFLSLKQGLFLSNGWAWSEPVLASLLDGQAHNGDMLVRPPASEE